MDVTSINKSLGTKWFTFYTKVRPIFICISAVIMSVASFVDILLGIYPFLAVGDILLYVLQFALAIKTTILSKKDYTVFVSGVKRILLSESFFFVTVDAVELQVQTMDIWVEVTILITSTLFAYFWYRLNIKYFERRLPQDDTKSSPKTQTVTAAPQPAIAEQPKPQVSKSSTSVTIQSRFLESILMHLKSIRESDVEVETAPNGDKIIVLYYNLKRAWTLCIAVDDAKKVIKMYTWFFRAAHARQNDIYKMLNDWNREIPLVTFTSESTQNDSFVIAQTSLLAIKTQSLEKQVLNTADSFVKIIDDLFDKMPSDLIVE